MNVIPYIPEHLAMLTVQPSQAELFAYATPVYARWLLQAGPAYTALSSVDGSVLAIVGLAQEWEGRAQAWTLLSPLARECMVSLTRVIRRFLTLSAYRRIEAQTPERFEQGCRWLELLGFESEGVMRNYYPDGGSAIRYARCV